MTCFWERMMIQMATTKTDTLDELANALKLPILKRLPELIEPDCSVEENLLYILRLEYKEKKLRSIARRTKAAGFPQLKTLDAFEHDRLPKLNWKSVLELATGQFVQNKTNVVAYGNSGVGKTHLAIAIGIEAIQRGYTVRFRKAADLVQELREAKAANQLTSCLKSWDRVSLAVLDELGYLSFDTEGSSLLFQFLSNRYETRSTIVTTNFEFSKWIDFLGDKAMAAALIDRFAHKTTFLNMNGPSYRLAVGLTEQATQVKPSS